MDLEKIGPFCSCLYRIQCLLSILKFDSFGLKNNWGDNTLGTDGGIIIGAMSTVVVVRFYVALRALGAEAKEHTY